MTHTAFYILEVIAVSWNCFVRFENVAHSQNNNHRLAPSERKTAERFSGIRSVQFDPAGNSSCLHGFPFPGRMRYLELSGTHADIFFGYNK